MSAELNPKQKRFADYYLAGETAGGAYVKAGYSKNGADAAACKLLRIAKVAEYVEAEREKLSEASRWKRYQLLDFYQTVLETPVGDVDETSVLAQEFTTEEVGEAIIRKKVKMVGKMDAAKELAAMLGWKQPEQVPYGITVVIGGTQDS